MKIKQIKKFLEYLFFFFYFLFEEIVIKSAKKLLAFIKSFDLYEKIMLYIQKSNDFILLFSFIFIVLLAEISSTFGLFLLAKGLLIPGIFFYILKIVIYIPSIDIFKRNKDRLLKYKIIQFGVFLYEKIEQNPIFLKFKLKLKKFKEAMLLAFKDFKKIFIDFWRNLWKV